MVILLAFLFSKMYYMLRLNKCFLNNEHLENINCLNNVKLRHGSISLDAISA